MQTSTEKFSLGKFLREVRAELKKVHWPTKKELLDYTVTVLATVVILSVLIFAIDGLVVAALGKIIGS
ncbi:MAG: preprotein translocase subunit SecE [Peptostreptococcaceae bacterium]|nr:preprotein translocase subunit SecE [Peptostreptococcaceae bacterium]